VTFYLNGIPTDPFAIRRVDIFEEVEKPENLVAQVPVVEPDATGYPDPLIKVTDATGSPLPGQFLLVFDIPRDFNAPAAYIDVWNFIGTDPAGTGGTAVDLTDESIWSQQCNKFFVFSEGFFADDGLVTPRIGFEALDKTFKKPEVRNLEIGIMPLPLYDFDFNRFAPLIPQSRAFITIQTENCEVLLDNQECTLGIRQGSFRANPFVIQCQINTADFLVGTYIYRVTLQLPNGETRVSGDFRIQII
jgi:hypothetical protein